MHVCTNAHLFNVCAFRRSIFSPFCIYAVMYVCVFVCTPAPVCVCVYERVCMSNTHETDSDLIQLKTNTLFCLQTLSWKQAGFPGYQRGGQIQATDREREREMSIDKKRQKGTSNKRLNIMAGSVLFILFILNTKGLI